MKRIMINDSFKVVFYGIEIEGREVGYWDQPLFEAMGIGTTKVIQKRNKLEQYIYLSPFLM